VTGFIFKLETADGTPAEPPRIDIETSVVPRVESALSQEFRSCGAGGRRTVMSTQAPTRFHAKPEGPPTSE